MIKSGILATLLLIISLPARADDAVQKVTPSAPAGKPDYIKRLEAWSPKNSTPPPAVDPVAFFGLKGKVTITNAKRYFDGGTVIIDLQDEGGTSLHMVKGAAWTHEEQKNDFITLSFPGRLQGNYMLEPGGGEEKALLALLRRGMLNTYGSMDISASSGINPATVVRAFIRHLSERTHLPEAGDK